MKNHRIIKDYATPLTVKMPVIVTLQHTIKNLPSLLVREELSYFSRRVYQTNSEGDMLCALAVSVRMN